MIQKVRFGDYELSRLMLGTVQFGLNYGIANKAGQPSLARVRDILMCAYEGGVNALDTAAGYGESEEVLGKALRELKITDKMVIETKVTHLAPEYSSAKAVDEVVEESVVRSLKRLGLERLPICLFHAEDNFHYIESLLKLKDKGLVEHVGSSVMTMAATRKILESGYAQAVQVPANVLDHRFIDAGIFSLAKKIGAAVFVRSIYLQGLILMPENEILPELRDVIPVRGKLESLAAEAGMSLAELAVRYVLTIDGAGCVLVGVDTVEQMRENIAMFSKGPLDLELMTAVTQAVPTLADTILMPNKWSKRMPDAKAERR